MVLFGLLRPLRYTKAEHHRFIRKKLEAISDISDVTWTAERSHQARREASHAAGLGGRPAPRASVSLAAK